VVLRVVEEAVRFVVVSGMGSLPLLSLLVLTLVRSVAPNACL
jgi:hypothetical protein